MITRFFLALCAFVFLSASPLHAQSCNPPDGWIKSKGTYSIGNVAVFGPDCETISDGGGPPSGPFRVYSSSTPLTPGIGDCGSLIILTGNVQTPVNVNATTFYGSCRLSFVNGELYTGATCSNPSIPSGCSNGGASGKIFNIPGFTQFTLYPGQSFFIQSVGSGAWIIDQPTAIGQVWFAPFAVTFFIDTAGSDTASDGLGIGSRAFKTLSHCLVIAQSQVYTRNFGSIQCMPTAGQGFQEFVQAFYPTMGGGTLLFVGNGCCFTWKPTAVGALQFGDGMLVGLQNVALDSNGVIGATKFVSGHNHGVLDSNTSVSISGGGSGPAFDCDFDTHFNFNNGLTSVGPNTQLFMFSTCLRSVWNIGGPFVQTTSPVFSRWANFKSNSTISLGGNFTLSGAFGAGTNVALLTGGSVLINASGIANASLPGGAPVPSNTTTTGFSAICTGDC